MASKNDLFKQIAQKISESKRILLSCHLGADGDSVASNLALYLFLKGIGKTVKIISPETPSSRFNFLPSFTDIETTDVTALSPVDFDLFLSVDSGRTNMISRGSISPDLLKKAIVIDHHPDNEKYGQINYIDPKAASTAEVLYDLFTNLKLEITKEISKCLIWGIFDDTRGFVIPKTTAKTLTITAQLIKMGNSLSELNFHFNKNKSLAGLHYIALVLSKLQVNSKYQYAWATVSKNDLHKAGIADEDAHGVSHYFESVSETNFGFLIQEYSDGKIYVMVRSRTDVDSSVLSKSFGGGGHRAGSGFRYLEGGDVVDIEKQVHKKIEEIYPDIIHPK